VYLFFKHTILPDGSVNACGASDGNADFIIGDIKQQDFKEIYSPTNERYLKLIRSHLERCFPETCKQCTAYRGISEPWYSYKYHRKEQITLPMFFQWLQQNRLK
jgi:radical SAM protein with 4Fe4S-binding SPASM domain